MNATTRTLAAAVALGALAAGTVTAGPATAATGTPKPKAVTIKAAQYPRLIDNPGKENDYIRFTYAQGLNWKLDGTSVAGFEGRTVVDKPVTAGAHVTVEAATGDVVPWETAVGTPTAWEFPAPKVDEAPAIDASTAVAIWNDLPGDKKDTVTLTNVQGVVWTVTTGSTTRTFDSEAFRGKPTLAVPATPATLVEPSPADGYTFDPKTPHGVPDNSLTTSPEVVLSEETLDATIETGENPLDKTKGYGPGAAVETVKITGIPGMKYAVGSRKAVAVNGVAYLPVDPDDLEEGKGTVQVKVTPGKGYTVPAGYAKDVSFIDKEQAPTAVVGNADIGVMDKGGISADALTIKASQGMTWWVGQADKAGKTKFVVQKPGKNGVISYKVKHASKTANPNETATVYVKAVANRGWLVDTTNLKTTEYEFKREATVIAANNVEVKDTDVTLRPYEGISAWNVTYTTKVGTKTAAKRLAVKPIDITNTGATTMTIPFADATDLKAEPKVMKDYTAATQ